MPCCGVYWEPGISNKQEGQLSIGLIVEFKFKPGIDGAGCLTENMSERLLATACSCDGCEYAHLYADPDDPNHLFLLERSESRAKYERYLEWANSQQETSEAMALLEGEPTWTYLDDTGA